MTNQEYLLRDYRIFKAYGKETLNLGNLHYDYLVSEGKIPIKAKNPQNGLKYAKERIIEGYKVDLEIASPHMKVFWQGKIDNIDEIIDKALKSKGDSVVRQKVFDYFKTYTVNEFFRSN